MDSTIFTAFEKWISQRSRIDWRDYGTDANGRRAFAQGQRSIAKDRKRAKAVLALARDYPFDAGAMQDSLERAFSGRLRWIEPVPAADGQKAADGYFDYYTGQYFPTEFAVAASVVLETYIDTVRPKHAPVPGTQFNSISAIKAAAHAAGSHWFDKSSMRFFRSRILPEVYTGKGGIYFVTSEEGPYSPRRYSIRKFDPATADISTFGPFNEMSRERAMRIARIAAHAPEAAKEALEA